MKLNHNKYIRRCLEIAKLGNGSVSPNPMVGAVIVVNDEIIGEGFHRKYGEPHAEVNAINSVKNQTLLTQATIYVSLEPCSHFGKTPPCADLIIEKQIPRVVIAAIDSNSVVCGNGISKLKAAGIDVITGVLEHESNELNKAFNTFQIHKRPFIILKWAETLDGFIDKQRNSANISALKISNQETSIWVHQLRSEVDAILIGKNTGLLDNPNLNTRKWKGKNPTRVVIDRKLSIPNNFHIYNQEVPTLIFNDIKSGKDGIVEFIHVSETDSLNKIILKELYLRDFQSVLVEGGAKTIQSFIDQGLWDKMYQIKGHFSIQSGVSAPILSIDPISSQSIGNNKIHYYENYS